ncbi:anion permease [Rhodoferax sp.]|uniref:anion permease n=1 Tax=Rhodoferax sp. TaxID=50421 RepID=UPI0025E1F75D|nr:anion permease [Rhodoferax sp.]MCM2342120.1 anion permease [Rhodoferax sp.]
MSTNETTSSTRQAIAVAVPIVLGLAIWFTPAPEGLSLQAWHRFAIFAATIFTSSWSRSTSS